MKKALLLVLVFSLFFLKTNIAKANEYTEDEKVSYESINQNVSSLQNDNETFDFSGTITLVNNDVDLLNDNSSIIEDVDMAISDKDISDEVISDEVISDEVISDEVISDEVISDEVIIDSETLGMQFETEESIVVKDEGSNDSNVDSALEIIEQPKSINANPGDDIVFSVKTNKEASFLWMRSKDNGITWEKAYYAGYTTEEMYVTVQDWVYNYLFYCVINDSFGNEISTDIVYVSHNNLELKEKPTDILADIGDAVTFSLQADGHKVKYLWMRSKDNGVTWEKAYYAGYTTNEMVVQVREWTYDYLFYCKLTDSKGNEIDSDIVRIKHYPVEITLQPQSVIASIGENVVFNVEAKGTQVRYLWMRSKDQGATWEKAYYSGYTTNEMIIPVKEWVYNYSFKCLITDGSGNEIESNIVKINHYPVEITTQPNNLISSIGENAVFNVEAEGDRVKYLWMRSKDNGDTWEKAYYDGYTTNKMVVPVKEWTYNYLFLCKISDSSGNEINTNIVKIKHNPVEIIKQPENVIREIGENAVFKVEAKGTGLRYLWMRSKDGGNSWEYAYYDGYRTNTMTVPIKLWVYNYKFYCIITDADGNVVNSDYVCVLNEANNIDYNVKLSSDDHTYSENVQGKSIILRQDVANNAIINDYSVVCDIPDDKLQKLEGISILRFVSYAENACGHIKVSLNDNAYNGTFSLPIEKTEYYIPIKDLETINRLSFEFQDVDCKVYLTNVELINYQNIQVTSLKTGLFNIENTVKTIFYENDALAAPSDCLETDEKYLYSVKNGILRVYTKDDMRQISSLSGLGSTRDIELYGNYIIISSRENGIYFIDSSDINELKIISHYDALELVTGIDVYDHYVFACSRMYGLEIIDIENIYDPVYISHVMCQNEEFYDCCISNGYLYVSVWAHKKVEIYSLDDVANPVLLKTILIDGECGGIKVQNNILYIVTGYHGQGSVTDNCASGYGMGNGMEIYDVSDANNPKWLSSSKIDGRYRNAAFDHWRIRVSGKYAYFTNIFNGVYIYDISNPSAPKRVNHIIIYIDKESSNYHKINQGSFILPYDTLEHGQGLITGIAVDNGSLYIGDSYTGIYKYVSDYIEKDIHEDGMLSKGDRKEVQLNNDDRISKYSAKHAVYAVEHFENNIYLACSDEGIEILDENLQKVNTVKTAGAVRDIKIIDDYLYTAENDAGLGVYKIQGETLVKVNQLTTGLYNTCFSQIEVNSSKNQLFIQAGWARIAIYNIEDRAFPILLNSFNTQNMYYRNLASGIANDNVFAYSDVSKTYLYNVDENGVKELVGQYNTNMTDRDGIANYDDKLIMISGNGYYLVNRKSGISENKITIPRVTLRGKVVANNGLMVVCNQYTSHVYIIDISDIMNPKLKEDILVDGNPDIAYIYENEIYIPCRNSGLLRIRVD